MTRLNQAGSHLVAVLVGLVVLGGVGFAGYTVMTHQKTAAPVASTTASRNSAPATIKTTADLTTTEHALDNASAQVSGSLNDSSLNNDLNDLL